MEAGGQHNMLERRGVLKKHPHTFQQIQKLEESFQACQHPDARKIIELSRELGSDPFRIKFWFQNRRTQLKKELSRAENRILRAHIELNYRENMALMEAVNCKICQNCQMLKENNSLKEELNRLRNVISGNLAFMPSEPFPPAEPNLAFTECLSNMQGGNGASMN